MYYLGIDVSKATLELSDAQGRIHSTHKNSRQGVREIVAKARRKAGAGIQCVLESTSTYHHVLIDELSRAGVPFTVINPARTKAYAASLGMRAKTDKVDACLLASLGKAFQLRPSHRPDARQEQIRFLRRHREAIEEQINANINQLEAFKHSPWTPPAVIKSLKSVIRHLKRQAEAAERDLRELVAQDEQHASFSSLLQSIPGVAERTAFLLLAEMPLADQCSSSRSWVAFAGVCPQPIQSGASSYARLSRIGSRRVRKQLYMAAVAAMKHNPAVAALALRLQAKGKSGRQIVMAAMNKLIRICYGVIINRKPFNPTMHIQHQNA